MQFKYYDILCHLVPGYFLLSLFYLLKGKPLSELSLIPMTGIAYIIGYFINTLSSYFENIYYTMWGGRPSDKLLEGNDSLKVKFFEHAKAKELLLQESTNNQPSNHELFSIAMRWVNKSNISRVEEFSSSYALSRVILTTMIITSIAVLIKDYKSLLAWVCLAFTILAFFRAKERGYYYAREVLINFIQLKQEALRKANTP